jgi:sugar/nucleoside kinase (ribokinase family)
MPTWEKGGIVNAFALQGGGPAGTAMAAASRLGVSTGFIGTIGNDDIAAFKRRSLTEYGIDTSRLVLRPFPEHQIAFVYVHAETGERVFAPYAQEFAYPITAAELDRDYLTAADYLLLDGTCPEAGLQAARWMREAGKTVLADMEKTAEAVPSRTRELVALLDVVICGEGFLNAFTGEADVAQAGRALLDSGPRIVVETLGARGSHTVTARESFHTPAFDVAVVNTTGAGDVFHGAFIVGLSKGWELRRIVRFASAVSAIACTRLSGHDRFPTYVDVESFLGARPSGRP